MTNYLHRTYWYTAVGTYGTPDNNLDKKQANKAPG